MCVCVKQSEVLIHLAKKFNCYQHNLYNILFTKLNKYVLRYMNCSEVTMTRISRVINAWKYVSCTQL